MIPHRIAIIGGGPAGAFAAAELARAGREVFLFDEKLAWEKPCGGGLTDKALARWPFLRDTQAPHRWINDCELIAPSGRRVALQLDRPIAIFSRLALNGLLLDRARCAGARVLRERITRIDGTPGDWNLQSSTGKYRCDFVVLAAGARNPFRAQFSMPVGPENFLIAVGFYIPGTSHLAQIKFVKGLHGYFWIFPRSDHFSAGICGRMHGKSTAELRRLLEDTLPEFGLGTEGARFYAHIIPSFTARTLQSAAFSGDGWALAGDAAGFVDAITGEGLYYALRSAELLSQALLADAPESYSARVKQDFLPELERASRIADRFYAGKWLGGSVTERMVEMTRRSPRFRELMRDLFAGTQEYSDLKQRVKRSLPRIAAEALVSTLWSSRVETTAMLGKTAGRDAIRRDDVTLDAGA
jgi:flavin-dependent dehydrogenase